MDRSYWDDKRKRLHRWITENGSPSFAEMYEGAVVILHEKPPGYVRFVSHAVRDIMNGMAKAKLGVKRQRAEYPQLVGRLLALWESYGLPKSSVPQVGQQVVTETPEVIDQLNLPPEVVKLVQHLFAEHEAAGRRSRDLPIHFYTAFFSKGEPSAAFIRRWNELHKWFQGNTHDGGKVIEDAEIAQLDVRFSRFEEMILAAADSYQNTLRKLDEILDEANKRSG